MITATIINAGEFDGKGKAFAVAQKLNKQLEKIKDRQFYDKFEVWVKGGHRENTRSYVVITTESKKMLIHDQLSSMREHLKQDFKLEGSTVHSFLRLVCHLGLAFFELRDELLEFLFPFS